MKKILPFLFFGALLVFAFRSASGPSSSGAPASHTGAPDEKTCGAVGCHDDNPINKGSASVSLDFGNGTDHYSAGETYPIKIKISDAGKTRFGFQLTAISSKSNLKMGNFQISDSLRTQIVKNVYELKERDYVTYTFHGTDAVSNGIGEWQVNWTAPTDCSADVVFYAGSVSANDDMSDKGDKVYTTSLTISKHKNEK